MEKKEVGDAIDLEEAENKLLFSATLTKASPTTSVGF